jgi:UDP-N-acetylmuramate dehydrogenase
VPLIVLGGGSNTVFADGTINALVARITASEVKIEGDTVSVWTGKNLATLVNELAEQNLDLSALTGIPGTVGGAVFGNAGQGPNGVWLDAFVQSVTVFVDGKWKTMSREDCRFSYRESVFKNMKGSPVLWRTVLRVPKRAAKEIQADIGNILQKRIETQPHRKTAGSCFKAMGDVPAWQLIDCAGLRGREFGGIQISEKHANFLLNTGKATFHDVENAIREIRTAVGKPLAVEMRLYFTNGSTL